MNSKKKEAKRVNAQEQSHSSVHNSAHNPEFTNNNFPPYTDDEYKMKQQAELNEKLVLSVRLKEVEGVKRCLKYGADANTRSKVHSGDDLFERTVLMEAVAVDMKEICEILIDAGADVNAIGDVKTTALKLAAWKGQYSICELLIRHGANINYLNESTALMEVAGGKVLGIVGGRLQTCKLLVEHGADVNLIGRWGMTALLLAAERMNVALVEYLLSVGANPLITSQFSKFHADGDDYDQIFPQIHKMIDERAEFWRLRGLDKILSISPSIKTFRYPEEFQAFVNSDVVQKFSALNSHVRNCNPDSVREIIVNL